MKDRGAKFGNAFASESGSAEVGSCGSLSDRSVRPTRALQVCLVLHDYCCPLRRLPEEFFVLVCWPLRRVEHDQDKIGVGKRLHRLLNSNAFGFVKRAADAGG